MPRAITWACLTANKCLAVFTACKTLRNPHSEIAGRPLGEAERLCLERARQLCAPEPFSLHLANFNRSRRRARATEMLAELKEAKVEAQRQYLVRKVAGVNARPPEI